MIAAGGPSVDWSQLPQITLFDLALYVVLFCLSALIAGVVTAAIREWFDDRQAKKDHEHKLREAREFRDEYQRTTPSRPCDACGDQPTTLYFDGYACIDLCHACASEAAEAGVRG